MRLELHRLEPIESGSREVRPVCDLTIALPIDGFARALGILEGVRDQLIREGILMPNPARETTPQSSPHTNSPNFS
jgi:hypothetical protein